MMDMKINIEKIIKQYEKGKSIRQIAVSLPLSASKIRQILKNNIELRTSQEGLAKRKENYININNDLENVITGEMLGDGCIIKRTCQSKFSFRNKHKDYASWLANIFIKNNIKLAGDKVYKNKYYDERYNKWYVNYSFSTHCSVQFHELENVWYRERKKVVPKNIKLFPKTILHWYLGDGSLPKGNYIIFCTDCFNLEEVKMLSHKLNNTIGIKSLPIRYKNNFRIFVPKSSVQALLKYIGPCPISSMEYKWNVKKMGKVNEKINITFEDLHKYYITNNMTRKQISEIYRCSKATIEKKIRDFSLYKRERNKNFEFDYGFLKSMYINENMTMKDLANYFNCSYQTIKNNLKRLNIKKKNWRRL